ncbi:hypothetical protein [Sphingomonas sp. RB1R13]|uniref:hypothetical protein n=1 Tax=Sphingomonas sp. RB1R13 TaxID=3096159 RepID=UPI002FCC417C
MAGWKKPLLLIAAFVSWFSGLILAGGWGYPSQYFWFSASILAIAIAVAPFWRRRGSTWYWPSVALITGINLTLMYLKRDDLAQRDLPAKGIVQGLLVLDCMASWLLMVALAYLADRRFAWQG